MFVPVTINRKTINMENDAGIYFIVMPEIVIKKMFADINISYTLTRLVG